MSSTRSARGMLRASALILGLSATGWASPPDAEVIKPLPLTPIPDDPPRMRGR